ncbi:hypothetical protein MASR1M45_23200 [Candidatus Kapaibacterium sp.]
MIEFMKRLIILMILTVLSNDYGLFAQSYYQPANLNFEKGIAGIKPPSWTLPRKIEESGVTAELSKDAPFEGEFCLLLTNPNKTTVIDENSAVPVYQAVDSYIYRGKKIRLSANARLVSSNLMSRGELWLIGRSTKEKITVSKYLDNNPVLKDNWQNFEITIDIPAETNELRFGILLKGDGKLYADNFRIEILQPHGAIDEPIRQLNEKELNNLKTFTSAYAYLNFFNAANTLNSAQNEILTLKTIKEIENAKNENDFLNVINTYAKILSPVAQVSRNSNTEVSYNKPSKAVEYLAFTRQINGGPVDRPDDLFSSSNVNVFASTRKRECSFTQNIEVLKYKGKTLKISSSIRVEQASPGANAQIWVRADKIGSKENIVATTVETPAMSKSWKRYETSIELPNDVYTIKLALIFIGEGKANFDDVKIEVFDKKNKIEEIPVTNAGFEQLSGSGLPLAWEYEQAVIHAGYMLYVDSANSTKGRYSLAMESEQRNRINFPVIGKIYTYNIGNGYYLHIPHAYYGDENGVLPTAKLPQGFNFAGKPDGYNPHSKDRLTRMASVIKLWGIIKHFSPDQQDSKILDEYLSTALKNVSASEENTEQTLEQLLKLTGDFRARVWHTDIDNDYTLPFIIRNVKEKYLVSTIVDSTLNISQGDEVLSINNISVNEYVNKRLNEIPGSNDKFKITKALAELRAGSKGTQAEVLFRKKDGSEHRVKTERKYMLQSVYEPKPLAVYEIEEGIVYIDLTDMTDGRLKEFIEALAQREAFIFDLRGMTGISEHFLGLLSEKELKNALWEIPVYTTPDKSQSSKLEFGGEIILPKGKLAGKKYVFMIDERTTGYSEAIISIVKHNQIGEIIGSPSSGNASEVYPVRLFGGYSASISGLNVYSPDRKRLFNNPVVPNISYEYELPSKGAKYDSLIEKAFEIIKNQ